MREAGCGGKPPSILLLRISKWHAAAIAWLYFLYGGWLAVGGGLHSFNICECRHPLVGTCCKKMVTIDNSQTLCSQSWIARRKLNKRGLLSALTITGYSVDLLASLSDCQSALKRYKRHGINRAAVSRCASHHLYLSHRHYIIRC